MGLFSEKDIPPPQSNVITTVMIVVAFVLIVWMRRCGGSPGDIPLGDLREAQTIVYIYGQMGGPGEQ